MQEREDVFHDWNEEEKELRPTTVTATAITWAAQNIFGFALLFYTFRIPGFNVMDYYIKGTVLAPLLIGRAVPLLALFLLLRGRKSGWILTTICCVGALLTMYNSVWNTMQGLWQGLDGGFLPTVGFLLIFLLSVLTFILLLTQGVRRYFDINLRELIRSVTAGILVVMLLRLFVTHVVSNP